MPFGVIDDAGLEIVASFGGTGDLQQFGGNAPDMSKGYEALKQSHPNIDYLGTCKLVPIAGIAHPTGAKDKARSSHKTSPTATQNVQCSSTKGIFTIEMHPEWAPIGEQHSTTQHNTA